MRKFLLAHRAGVLALLLSLVSLLLLWSGENTNLGSPREAGMVVTGVFQGGLNSFGYFFGSTFDSISELSRLQEEHARLLDRVQEMERQQSDLDILRRENQSLRKILDFSSAMEARNIPAQVIAKEPGVVFSSFVINKGYNHGVRPQAPVICVVDGRKALVGKISSVSAFTSQVLPLFDRRNNVAGRISESRYEGLIQGNGEVSGTLRMIYVDQQAKSSLGEGDLVVTSGLSAMYPPDIPVGKVGSFTEEPQTSTIEIELRPLANFNRLEYVYVLLPGQEEP